MAAFGSRSRSSAAMCSSVGHPAPRSPHPGKPAVRALQQRSRYGQPLLLAAAHCRLQFCSSSAGPPAMAAGLLQRRAQLRILEGVPCTRVRDCRVRDGVAQCPIGIYGFWGKNKIRASASAGPPCPCRTARSRPLRGTACSCRCLTARDQHLIPPDDREVRSRDHRSPSGSNKVRPSAAQHRLGVGLDVDALVQDRLVSDPLQRIRNVQQAVDARLPVARLL